MENTKLSAMVAATEDPRAIVSFRAADVQGKGVILAAGDEVEFAVVTGGKPGELMAKSIARTKEAPKADEGYTSGRFKLGSAQQTKFAKGPDGTRGFAAGRGKPIAANGSGGGGEVGA